MALILPRSVFLHCPKTGGSWVRVALRQAGLACREFGHTHTNFTTGLLQLQPPEWYRSRVAFLFVRHPLSWYQSRWAYRMKYGWDMRHPLDAQCASNEFTRFVTRVLDLCPDGWVSRCYLEYADHAPPGVTTYVGRQEQLVTDLVAILDRIGESYHRAALLATPRSNTAELDGRLPQELARYSPALRQRVLQVEQRAIQRWYPNSLDYHAAPGCAWPSTPYSLECRPA